MTGTKRDKNVTNATIMYVLMRARAGQNTFKIIYFRTLNPLVVGSIPTRPTKFIEGLQITWSVGPFFLCDFWQSRPEQLHCLERISRARRCTVLTVQASEKPPRSGRQRIAPDNRQRQIRRQ